MNAGFSQPEDFGIGRLFYAIRDAVVVANARTECIVLWNNAAEKLLGYTAEEAIGMPLHGLVPPELTDRHRAGINRYQQRGEGNLIASGHPVEVEGIHKQGHRVPVELTLTEVPEESPTGDRFALAIIRDATDRKVAEDARVALREAELRRRQALELNDTIVQGLAAASMAIDLGEQERAINSIRSTLEKAQGLVTDLLADLYPEGVTPGDLVREQDDETDPSSHHPPGADTSTNERE